MMALHVTEQGEVVVCHDEAIEMYKLEGDPLHAWKTKIDEPTGITTMNIGDTDFIMVSQIISKSKTGDSSVDGTKPSLNDRIEIQTKDKTDRQTEATPWGPIAYSTPGECGLGSNLTLLKSGQLALAVKESDEAPCVIHVLNCSTTTFGCIRKINTTSIHPPAICGLQLGRDVIVIADCWNSNEQCSILAYDEETGVAIIEVDEQRLKDISGKEDFLLSFICSTSRNTLLVSEGRNNVIFEMTLDGELNIHEVMNPWDHTTWHLSKMAWHAKSHSLAICHKNDNSYKSITDGEHSASIYTMF